MLNIEDDIIDDESHLQRKKEAVQQSPNPIPMENAAH